MSDLTLHGIGMAGGKLTVSRGGSAVATRIGKRYTGGFAGIDRTLQVNLEGVTDFSITQPFINIAKTVRDPEILNGGTRVFTHADIVATGNLDADGYVNDWDPSWSGYTVSYYWDWPDHAPLFGRYVFTYDGADACTLTATAGGVTVISNLVGRVEFDVTANCVFYLRFSSITAANYPRNFECVRTDLQAAYDAGQKFNPDFLADLQSAACLRFMDWMETNANEIASWADYPTESKARWHVVPVSVMVDLCNELGVDGWWQIPGKSAYAALAGSVDTSFATSFATYLKANLDPDLVAKVAYSNEVWNFGFTEIHNAMNTQAIAAGWSNTDRDGYCAKINVMMAQAMKAVYGDEAPARFKWVAESGRRQTDWTQELVTASNWQAEEPSAWVDPATVYDAVAVAHYYGSAFINESVTETASFTMDVGTDGTDYGKFGASETLTPSAVNLVDIAVLRTNGADGLFLSMQDGGAMPFNKGSWFGGSPDVAFTLRFPGLSGVPVVEFRRAGSSNADGYVGTSTGIRTLIAAETSLTFDLVDYARSTELVDLINLIDTGATQAELITYVAGRVQALGYIDEVITDMTATKAIASGAGLPLESYEGWCHMLHSFSTGIPDVLLNPVVDVLGPFTFSAENAAFCEQMWDGLKTIIDGPFQIFSAHCRVTKYGAFGMRTALRDTNPLQTYVEARSASETPWWADNRREVP